MKLNEIVIEIPSDIQILKSAKKVGYERVDIEKMSEPDKKKIRIKNNDALAFVVERLTDMKRQKVKDILQNNYIPDYEVAVVVGDRYANYYHNGFVLGSHNEDTNVKNAGIDKAVKFLLRQ